MDLTTTAVALTITALTSVSPTAVSPTVTPTFTAREAYIYNKGIDDQWCFALCDRVEDAKRIVREFKKIEQDAGQPESKHTKGLSDTLRELRDIAKKKCICEGKESRSK
jgi:hypothetical protein